MGLEVIYGDTDSIMVNTNSVQLDEVYKIGNRVSSCFNSSSTGKFFPIWSAGTGNLHRLQKIHTQEKEKKKDALTNLMSTLRPWMWFSFLQSKSNDNKRRLECQLEPDGSLQTTEELKGLDIVGRDWCDFLV
jgi:DNA polymerase alpha subunit A